MRDADEGQKRHPRAVFVTALGERAIVVHAFEKKSQRTPLRALEVARQRAKAVK